MGGPRELRENKVPDMPSYLRAKPTANSLLVRWWPPRDQTTIVRGYELGWGVGKPDIYTKVLDGKRRYYKLKKLQPSTEYVISIKAYNQLGDGLPVYQNVKTQTETKMGWCLKKVVEGVAAIDIWQKQIMMRVKNTTVTHSKGKLAAAEKEKDHIRSGPVASSWCLNIQEDQFQSENDSLSVALKKKNDDERKWIMNCSKKTASKLLEEAFVQYECVKQQIKIEKLETTVDKQSVIKAEHFDGKAHLLNENETLKSEVIGVINLEKHFGKLAEAAKELKASQEKVIRLEAEKEKFHLESEKLMKKLEEKETMVIEHSVILDEKAQLLEENKRLQFEVNENIKKQQEEFSERSRLLGLFKKKVNTLQAEKIAAAILNKSAMDKMRCEVEVLKKTIEEQDATTALPSVTFKEKVRLLWEIEILQSKLDELVKHLEDERLEFSEAEKEKEQLLEENKRLWFKINDDALNMKRQYEISELWLWENEGLWFKKNERAQNVKKQQTEFSEFSRQLESFKEKAISIQTEKNEKSNLSLRADGVPDEIVTFVNNIVHVRLSAEEADAVVKAVTARGV